MKKKIEIGLLGGTFDPIHNAHLYIAQATLKKLGLDEIQFIPAQVPPHRALPLTPVEDRVNMVKLAIKDDPKFKLNLIEITRPGPSYAIDTLKTLASLYTESHLYFILGQDAFNAFDQWHQWQDILNYCNLVVINRPGYAVTLQEPLKNWCQQHVTSSISQLKQTPCGLIYFLEVPEYDLAATYIREEMHEGKDIKNQVPKAVAEYIQAKQLYHY